MSMLRDPEVEAGAMALAWSQRPGALFPKLSDQTAQNQRDWWNARSDSDRDLYRYQASVVLEAVDALKGFAHAAE